MISSSALSSSLSFSESVSDSAASTAVKGLIRSPRGFKPWPNSLLKCRAECQGSGENSVREQPDEMLN